ncbi:MAG: PAS domain-containing sensor histidine kinase [Arcobacteraceae bacterium]
MRFYSLLYNNFADGISIISENKIIDCNDTLVNLFGYTSKKEFLSEHPLNLTPAFQPDNTLSCDKAQEMMETAEKLGKSKFDWVFLDKDKNEKWIEIDILKLKKELFVKQKFCMVWRDISLRVAVQNELKEFNSNLESIVKNEINKNKEQEKQLLMQSKLAQLGEMISMIAHQWRQPLAAISSSVIDLQMKLILNKNDKNILDYVENHLNDVESFTENLTHTIDDFRDFYKPNKLTQKTTLNTIANKAYNMIKNYFVSYNIEVVFDYRSSKEICVFENELIQVCLNILQNSRENFLIHDSVDPKIVIMTQDLDDGVFLEISDNGGGCEEEILNKIFEPYFSTKEKKNGTGLGLYMSLKILKEHHNGTITARNTDDGICFRIELKD